MRKKFVSVLLILVTLSTLLVNALPIFADDKKADPTKNVKIERVDENSLIIHYSDKRDHSLKSVTLKKECVGDLFNYTLFKTNSNETVHSFSSDKDIDFNADDDALSSINGNCAALASFIGLVVANGGIAAAVAAAGGIGGPIAALAANPTFIAAVQLVMEGSSIWLVLTSGVLLVGEIIVIAGSIFALA